MKNKIINALFISTIMLCTVVVKAQSLTPTSSISVSGSADNFKGGYTFSYAPSGTPWNGALISFGGFASNNYDCQISSDYGPNGGNHISFRTKNGDANTWNSWNELATRGTNNFIGNQTISGNIGIGTTAPNSKLTIRSGNTGVSIHPGGSPYFGTLAFNREAATGEIFDSTGQAFQINNGGGDKNLHFQVYNSNGAQIADNALVISGTNGNIGIGVPNPANKLDVNGTIHSREVKVDLTGWSDFVFKKEYDLPTLEEVEKHIVEKGHLENIPSEEDVLKNGINLGEMNTKLLQKIEELTLYTIEQNKKIQKLQEENKKFLDIEKRLEKIEKESK